MISDILNKIIQKDETYSLTADFAEVMSADNANKLLSVRMMQRSGGSKPDYDDVLFIGFQKPSVGTKGVVIFVGKQKYPVFIPLLQNLGQKSGTVHIGNTSSSGTESESLGDSKATFTDANSWVQFDRTFDLFIFNGGSPSNQQWGMPDVIAKLKSIAKDWYYDSINNPTKIKLILGDLAKEGGAKFHNEHHSGTVADIYANAEASHVENTYTVNQVKAILNIFKNNGVKYCLYNPKNYDEYKEYHSWVSNRVNSHENHFHIKF